MSRALQVPPPGFDDLSIEEKIDYVQALWGHIAADEKHVPVPDWHREILAERLADFEADPDGGRPWEEVEAELMARNT